MALPPPSSSSTHKWTYDVFLSFRGQDTRLGFISFLYQSLCRKGLHVFFDDDSIMTGENITPALFKAIEQSRIAIIVFSENYANSTFCLRELEKIFECFKEEGRLIYPVFYYVDPSELRSPRGSYAQALARLEERFKDDKDKVEKWRQTLSQAADLKGFHLQPKISNEEECIIMITGQVVARIAQKRELLDVAKRPVGLRSRVKEVISYLDLLSTMETKMVGIWGAGGIGKSTLARAVYNSIADNFEASCILSDIRKETKMSNLQEELLCRLSMKKNLKFGDYHEGVPIIKLMLSQKKILLILDNVDELNQLEALAGSCDWFGCGTRIIITTRNKQLLVSHNVTCVYDVKGLNHEESLKLLSLHAFGKENVEPDYVDVCNHAVEYSCGFPLALEVIGSILKGKEVDIWRSKLLQLKRTQHKDILNVLKLSYDDLGQEGQQVFLDLACFFNGEKLARVNHILHSISGEDPKCIIDDLIDRSLVKIEQGRVIMHDLIEDVGKVIVRQESPEKPGERSRLWFYKDILHVLLHQDKGTDKVKSIILNPPKDVEVQWSGNEFMNMTDLKMLVIRKACFSKRPKYLPTTLRWLEWEGYPFESLPNPACQTELVYLDLTKSYCKFLQQFDMFPNLSHVILRNCTFLRKIPNLSGASKLNELCLDGCTNLIKIDKSVGSLEELRVLSAMRCKRLKALPSPLNLISLEHLNLFGCSKLQRFPEISDEMKKMQTLDLEETSFSELPISICTSLPNLWKLTANSCKGMSHLKKSKGGHETFLDFSTMSSKMTHLYVSNCNLSYDSLALYLSHFSSVVHLDLRFSNFTILPVCIKDCHNLEYLLLDNCNQLQHIEGLPPNLAKFSALCCTSLTEPSKSQLLEQVFNFQTGKRNFVFPGKKFPHSLHCFSRGFSVSFWVRNEFPTIFLWILIEDDQDNARKSPISVKINDKVLSISADWLFSPEIMTNHIYIVDMESLIHNDSYPPPLDSMWNEVKVSTLSARFWEKEAYNFGVHVYGPESNFRNIRFEDPKVCVHGEQEVGEGVQPDLDMSSYELKGYMGTTFPTWLGCRSYQNLNNLRLMNCQNCERIPTLGQLPALRSLTIVGLQRVVTIGSEFFKENDHWASVSPPFPSLQTLSFQHMISWEKWHQIAGRAFPKLRDLEFYNCPKLIGDIPHKLAYLQDLRIEQCPLFASSIPKYPNIKELHIIKSQNVVLHDQALPFFLCNLAISGDRMLEVLSRSGFNCKITGDLKVWDCSEAVLDPEIHVPPFVKKLCLGDCKIAKFVLVSNVPTLIDLQRICIHNCEFLRSLFDLDMQSLLPNLKELSLKGCPEMERFSEGSLLPSSLKKLEIINCDKLLSCHTQWQHIPSITSLIITTPSETWHCTGLQHLTSLQNLQILNSPMLEKIEGGMMPPSLQKLGILSCCLLEERCRNKDAEIWHKIFHVPYISLSGEVLKVHSNVSLRGFLCGICLPLFEYFPLNWSNVFYGKS